VGCCRVKLVHHRLVLGGHQHQVIALNLGQDVVLVWHPTPQFWWHVNDMHEACGAITVMPSRAWCPPVEPPSLVWFGVHLSADIILLLVVTYVIIVLVFQNGGSGRLSKDDGGC
jgi:hypothetical protein